MIVYILYRILIKYILLLFAWCYLKTFYLQISSYSLSDLMILICILMFFVSYTSYLANKNEDISSFCKGKKWQFFIFLYVRKYVYFVLFCIRDIFDPINKNKFICVKKGVILKYHLRVKHQFCIFSHTYILHITVYITGYIAFSRRKVGVFIVYNF